MLRWRPNLCVLVYIILDELKEPVERTEVVFFVLWKDVYLVFARLDFEHVLLFLLIILVEEYSDPSRAKESIRT